MIFGHMPAALFPVGPQDASRAVRREAWKNLGGDGLLLALLALLAAGLGLGGNRLRAQPLPLVYASKAERLQRSVARLAADHAPSNGSRHVPVVIPAPEMIDLMRFHDLMDAKAIALDARPALFFRAGHVPGAHALSRQAFETEYARERAFLEAHRQDQLVVYCSGDACVDSRMVAQTLQKLGYPHVLVFAGGWEEWQQAGQPEERE